MSEQRGWMPIETAPKDGRTVTVRFRRCAPYPAYWHSPYGWSPIPYNAPSTPDEWMPSPPKEPTP